MVERTMSIKRKPQPEEHNISQIIAAARKDPQVFGELYLLYAQPVFRYLFSRIGSYPEAEDATAETFLAALERFPNYRHDGYFASWLFSIARGIVSHHLRSECANRWIPLDDIFEIPDGNPTPEVRLIS